LSQITEQIHSSDIGDILENSLRDMQPSFDDTLRLLKSEDVHLMGLVAGHITQKKFGKKASFVNNIILNYTNVCITDCKFCAFYRSPGDSESYTLTLDQIEARVKTSWDLFKIRQVLIQGGHNPNLGIEYYEDAFRLIRKKFPEIGVHGLSASEIDMISKIEKTSTKEVLSRLKAAGLDSMPGGGAELFHPEIRDKIVRGKCSGQEWLDTIEQAHNLGIKSNSTMLFGHIEKPEHIIDHLIKLREVLKRTHGFLTFIPLKFSLENTELEQKGLISSESASTYDLRIIAISRLMLSGYLDNISVYWVALGKKLSQVALAHGGNDLVGTAFSEEIYRAAGKGTNSTVLELANMAKEIGRQPAQRDTFFRILRKF